MVESTVLYPMKAQKVIAPGDHKNNLYTTCSSLVYMAYESFTSKHFQIEKTELYKYPKSSYETILQLHEKTYINLYIFYIYECRFLVKLKIAIIIYYQFGHQSLFDPIFIYVVPKTPKKVPALAFHVIDFKMFKVGECLDQNRILIP